jgi:AcrR family transcriptional regulator
MTPAKKSLRDRKRQLVQDTVLDAAEKLLQDAGDFSMRALADAAGVSFTTPFKHFKGKGAILRALAERLGTKIVAEFNDSQASGRIAERIHLMNNIGIKVMFEQPVAYRSVIAALSVPHPEGPNMAKEAEKLWELSLGELDGIEPSLREIARKVLPSQLAISFRGVLSLWVAGELSGEDLVPKADLAVDVILLGLLNERERDAALKRIEFYKSRS